MNALINDTQDFFRSLNDDVEVRLYINTPFIRIISIIAISLLCSCTTPSSQYSNLARNFAFAQSQVQTDRFTHTYYLNLNAIALKNKRNLALTPGGPLHIYLEGDGTPWVEGKWIAIDPTPRRSIMLPLMHLDTAPAILLGRPCYHLDKKDKHCVPNDWTMGRYSSKVVASMVQAIEKLQAELGFSSLAIFGHSGGGSMAILIANALKNKSPKVDTIVTLAANIDTDAWTASLSHLPLTDSINPANLPSLPEQTDVLHLFGSDDSVVQVDLFDKYLSNNQDVRSHIYNGFDHTCCWQSIWPSILSQIVNHQNSPLNPAVTE